MPSVAPLSELTVKQNISPQWTGKVISPILQIRKLRLSGVDQLVSGHPASGEGTHGSFKVLPF